MNTAREIVFIDETLVHAQCHRSVRNLRSEDTPNEEQMLSAVCSARARTNGDTWRS
jgi:hypothetical protein